MEIGAKPLGARSSLNIHGLTADWPSEADALARILWGSLFLVAHVYGRYLPSEVPTAHVCVAP
jgi:hypothetical protein